MQGGNYSQDKKLIEFVAIREDFWPKDYDSNKVNAIAYEREMGNIKVSHALALMEILKKVK